MASFGLEELPVDFCYNRIRGVLKTFICKICYNIYTRERQIQQKWRKFHAGEHHNKYFSPNSKEQSPPEKLIVAYPTSETLKYINNFDVFKYGKKNWGILECMGR
jgi:hypothetical protein